MTLTLYKITNKKEEFNFTYSSLTVYSGLLSECVKLYLCYKQYVLHANPVSQPDHPSFQKNSPRSSRQESNSTKPLPSVGEAETIPPFIKTKDEKADNLINMCCISVWPSLSGLPLSQEVLAAGQWGTLISGKGECSKTYPFLITACWWIGWRKANGIIRQPDDNRPILMSHFSHCAASLSSPNLPDAWAAWENAPLPPHSSHKTDGTTGVWMGAKYRLHFFIEGICSYES